MLTLLTALHVVVVCLLIGIVLMQQPKSSGGGLFTSTGQSLLGTGAKDFWTKFTTVIAALFMISCLAMSAIPRNRKTGSVVSDLIQKQEQREQESAQKQTLATPMPEAQQSQKPAAVPKSQSPAPKPPKK